MHLLKALAKFVKNGLLGLVFCSYLGLDLRSIRPLLRFVSSLDSTHDADHFVSERLSHRRDQGIRV